MRRILLAGSIVGLVLGCAIERQDCEDELVCESCRECAAESRHSCLYPWQACLMDPACESLDVCIAECWAPEGEHSVRCERACRGVFLSGEWLYDEAQACVEDTCTLSCEW